MRRNVAWVSSARFTPYLREADQDESLAWELYEWNARVAAALSECFHHAEVLLRNAVMARLSRIHPLAYPWNTEMAAVVQAARRRAGPSGTATQDDVISDLTLGFWAQFFTQNPANDELWRHCLKDAFPASPGTRQAVHRAIADMRALRNRCAHQDSLLEADPGIELEKLLALVGWIDPEARRWMEGIERVGVVAAERPVAPRRDVLVLPVDDESWAMYRAVGAYVCPQERSFAPVEYLGFYRVGHFEISHFFPRIEARIVPALWSDDEAKRLLAGSSEIDRRLGKVMRYAVRHGWESGGQFQVFLLGDMKSAETLKRADDAPIAHHRRGRGAAFVQRHRYFAHGAVLAAVSTDQLVRDD